ncbi:hypothetical protein HDU92_001635 [Lobulomyces angularis]|nr:hypothetical protein HDU92_001635 [Lobulomyces angularis]
MNNEKVNLLQKFWVYQQGISAYDSRFGELTICEATAKHVKVKFTASKHQLNEHNSLHGGFINHVVDIIGFLPFVAASENIQLQAVSTDIGCSYVKSCKLGDEVTVKADLVHMGRTMGFSKVTLFNSKEEILAFGHHTLMFLKPKL